ncbi:MAG: hypothetical protein JSS64_04380 [Bacteroidetes bacterium]|nr:hypothetical protein [Bacteroidota bacterium]
MSRHYTMKLTEEAVLYGSLITTAGIAMELEFIIPLPHAHILEQASGNL